MAGRVNSDEYANSAGTGAPNFPFGFTGGIGNYFSGGFGSGVQWSTTSGSYVDGSNTGGNTLITRANHGLSVSAGASNVCGVTWTPSSSAAVYLVSVYIVLLNSGTNNNFTRIYDGTNVVGQTFGQPDVANHPASNFVFGVYAPATGSSVTLKLQFATAGGTLTTVDAGSALTDNVAWTIVQIY